LAEGWKLAAHYKWILNASAIHFATYWHPESLVHLLKVKPGLMNRPTGSIKTSNEQNNSQDSNGPNHFTPLHVASTLECKAIPTSILINKGANVEATDFEDKTPLHIAAQNGCTYKVMALLYDGNANVVPLDKSCETPLHQAKNSKIVDLLLTKATTKQILEIDTKTPLFDKILQNHPSSLNKYLDKMVTSNDTEADVHDQHFTFNLSMFNSIQKEKQNYLDKHIALIKQDSQQLLTHPLMRLFISLKWQPHKIRYQINFFIFLAFVLIFTIHGAICIDFLQCEDGKEGELVEEFI
jgi:ankyrin repeat protein